MGARGAAGWGRPAWRDLVRAGRKEALAWSQQAWPTQAMAPENRPMPPYRARPLPAEPGSCGPGSSAPSSPPPPDLGAQSLNGIQLCLGVARAHPVHQKIDLLLQRRIFLGQLLLLRRSDPCPISSRLGRLGPAWPTPGHGTPMHVIQAHPIRRATWRTSGSFLPALAAGLSLLSPVATMLAPDQPRGRRCPALKTTLE